MLSQTAFSRTKKPAVLTAVTLCIVLLAGCTQPPAQEPVTQETTGVAALSHIHGMSVDPDTGRILLATHEGLFDVTTDTPKKIGPTIDLMGFAADQNGNYYASGHPSPETGLPDPAGLIRSTDGGETWKPLSLQGASDFHALAVSGQSIIGYDGAFWRTDDRESWNTFDSGFQPYNLAGTSQSQVVLATTEQGVRRSGDGGNTWVLPQGAPLLLLTTFASKSAVVGVTPDGTVQLSRDGGLTWQETGGGVTGQPAAIAAAEDTGQLKIWVATDTGIEYSADTGATFSKGTK